MPKLVAFFLLLFVGKNVLAQQPVSRSSERSKIITIEKGWLRIDSFSIDPRTFLAVDSATLAPVPFSFFELKSNALRVDYERFRANFPKIEKLKVAFRVFPFDFEKPVFRLDSLEIIRSASSQIPIAFDYEKAEKSSSKNAFADGPSSMHYGGNYVRGISVGNAQNLVFNSNLNLQMDGRLGDDVELRAVISDNSAPLQPDGSTQRLQEFDRIFILLKRKQAHLLAGDYDLGNQNAFSSQLGASQQSTVAGQSAGYFVRYFKRAQGAAVQNAWAAPTAFGRKMSRDTFSIRAAAAVAKGKFSRQFLQVSEGNQGPYRLAGAEGERFIIVLAGTEKVFFDGELLRRGYDGDYLIDYNLGEIRFTPRRLVTAASRVIVEFEYADQDFLRSSVAASFDERGRKSRFFGHFYSEQDSKTAGGAQNLSENDRRALESAGDDLASVFGSGIDTASFSADRVLYKMVEKTVCGQVFDSVLVVSSSADSALFSARFTEVAAGSGNYELVQSAANGRVFRWVAPDSATCLPRGNFEPIVKLAAPQKLQIASFGAEIEPFRGQIVSFEGSASCRDGNRFSSKDEADDAGAAFFGSWRGRFFLEKMNSEKPKSPRWILETRASHEAASKNFRPLNPYRPAEFSRDWNVQNLIENRAENWSRAGLTVKKSGIGEVGYDFGRFSRAAFFDGNRHSATAFFSKRGFETRASMSLLATKSEAETTRFFRPRLDFSKKIRAATVGFALEKEKNERRPADQSDILSQSSFGWEQAKFFIQKPSEKGRFAVGAAWSARQDFASDGEDLKRYFLSNELNINGLWRQARSSNLSWNLTKRDLKLQDSTLTSGLAGAVRKPATTYLGRLDQTFSAMKNFVSATAGYEIGSGQEPKIQWVYEKVDAGQGAFFWNDRNADGLITVDEVEQPAFADQANLLRFVLPTNDFVRVNNVVLNSNLRLEPRQRWPKKTFLSRFSTQSDLQITRRVRADAPEVSAWNPFELGGSLANSALVTVNFLNRNALFLNRGQPRWDAQIDQKDTRQRLNLASGYESRSSHEAGFRGRFSPKKSWNLLFQAATGQKTSDAEAFSSRDFSIFFRSAQPSISFQPSTKFRTTVRGRLLMSENSELFGGEKAEQIDLGGEATASLSKQKTDWLASTRATAKLTFSKIEFDGKAATPLAFTMLEGLQPGRNWVWSLAFDRQIARNMQLNLSYEGRKTGILRVVHVGRAQVRATF